MFAPEPRLDDDERHALKWMATGALITAGATALCDLAKTELQGFLARRREAVKAKDGAS